ncbi:hypothetical protein LAV89_18005, partial [Rhizobium sp. VS19-DR121]|nr:hypothetical protein [Rhizobium sp. VS19-DR121]
GFNRGPGQRLLGALAATDSAAVDAVLVSVADHYRAKRDAADDPSGNLLATLDRSLAILGADAISTEAAGARRAMTGLRYNLFPDAPIFAANENRAAPDMTAAEKAA